MPVSHTAMSFLAAVTLAACFYSTKAATHAHTTRRPTIIQSNQHLTRLARVRLGLSRVGHKWIAVQVPRHWQPLTLPSASGQTTRARLHVSTRPEPKQRGHETPSQQQTSFWLRAVRNPSGMLPMRKLLGDQGNTYVSPMPKTRQQPASVTNGSYQQGDYGKGCFMRCRR